MPNERVKSIKILQELIGYFFHHGILDLEMQLKAGDDESRILVRGPCTSKPESLDELITLLEAPRQSELEGYYWRLLGSHGVHEELGLLGSLVDHGEATFEDGKLTIVVVRRKD